MIEFTLKIIGPSLALLTFVSGLPLLKIKMDNRRSELLDRLHQALKKKNKHKVTDTFMNLTGRRFDYSNIKKLLKKEDALYLMELLKKRPESVTLKNGQLHPTEFFYSYQRKVNMVFCRSASWALLVTLILVLVLAGISLFVKPLSALLLSVVILFITVFIVMLSTRYHLEREVQRIVE